MIVLTGADLFTSNIMFMTTALLHRRIGFLDLLRNWFVSFFGNLAGSLFSMAIIFGCKDTRN
jgi:formate/nitrite transporter FocA (FNT family)